MFRRKYISCLNITLLNSRRSISTSCTAYQKYVTDWRNKPTIIPVTEPKKGEPAYFENEALKLQPGPGYIDRLCEVWFDKISSQRDLTFKSADFLLGKDCTRSEDYLPKVDEAEPRMEYECVESLKNAPESVRNIFSIRYGERYDLVAKWDQLITDQVRLHQLDEQSLEFQVGALTASIRQLTHLLHIKERKPKSMRNKITELIEERKAVLTRLREQNTASFDAVLKKLKIAYLAPPLPEDDPGDQRKAWVTHVVQRKVEAIKEERLEKLRLELLEKRKSFVAQKEEKMAALDEEEKRLRQELYDLDKSEDDQGVLDLQPVGEYPGHTIDSLSEISMHEWMYRPPPTRQPIPMSDQLKKRFR